MFDGLSGLDATGDCWYGGVYGIRTAEDGRQDNRVGDSWILYKK